MELIGNFTYHFSNYFLKIIKVKEIKIQRQFILNFKIIFKNEGKLYSFIQFIN